jgi:hypothetical protein
LLVSEIIPIFLFEDADEIPLVPVLLLKAAFLPDSVRWDFMIRLKWIFMSDELHD